MSRRGGDDLQGNRKEMIPSIPEAGDISQVVALQWEISRRSKYMGTKEGPVQYKVKSRQRGRSNLKGGG